MVSKERDESDLYCYVQDIFPFQDIPLLLPDHTFNFKFTSEISLDQKDDRKRKTTLYNICSEFRNQKSTPSLLYRIISIIQFAYLPITQLADR